MKLIISREAAADLDRLRLFLAERDATATQRAIGVLVSAIHSLEVFPERGRPSGSSEIRELIKPFGHSAYLIRYVYLEERDELVILRVWHGRENVD